MLNSVLERVADGHATADDRKIARKLLAGENIDFKGQKNQPRASKRSRIAQQEGGANEQSQVIAEDAPVPMPEPFKASQAVRAASQGKLKSFEFESPEAARAAAYQGWSIRRRPDGV